MNPHLNADMASTILDERIQNAERAQRASVSREEQERDHYPRVTVRLAGDGDVAAIRRLEELEGRHLPQEPTLVAEVEGRVLAARSLLTRKAVADPFSPTEALVELLDLRSLHLRHGNGHRVGGAVRVGRFFRAVTAPIRS
jgi:hypothetical protein